MTCRHAKGDPNCTSTEGGPAWQEQQDYYEKSRREAAELEAARLKREKYAASPQPDDAGLLDIHRVGPHVVVKARYPSCKKCSYEGVKVLVYLNVTELQVARWHEIDPHFAAPAEVKKRSDRQAPSPAARFPASKEGWEDALVYAQIKAGRYRTRADCPRCDDQSFGEGNRG